MRVSVPHGTAGNSIWVRLIYCHYNEPNRLTHSSYSQSLFTKKIEYTLLLKGIPYNQVNVGATQGQMKFSNHKWQVPVVLPRKGISDLLGITYRRVPILTIGKDVYCDSR